jgi:hypothetical protein
VIVDAVAKASFEAKRVNKVHYAASGHEKDIFHSAIGNESHDDIGDAV